MNLKEIKMERKGYDFYIPLTKVQFDCLRDFLDDYVEKCSCHHCQLVLDDILAELNYQHSEWFPSSSDPEE